jgi:dimeric dUTPase (all-alpha-NTP-PPase superfamily)
VIEQLKFYMTEAPPELLEARREYIERVIVKKLRNGVATQKTWSAEFASDAADLIEAYRAGLAFFTEKGFNTEAQHG